MPRNTPQAKNAVVTCCSHSHGAPIVRVTTSQKHRQREHEDAHAAEDHQHGLEPVERLPFQVAMALQDQRAEIGHRLALLRRAATGDTTGTRRRRRAAFPVEAFAT